MSTTTTQQQQQHWQHRSGSATTIVNNSSSNNTHNIYTSQQSRNSPDDVREVHPADEVLGYGHRPLQVEHAVPPTPGHKNHLAGGRDTL